MGHDFNYRVDGTALVPTYVSAVRLQEGISGLRSTLVPVAYRDGVYVGSDLYSDARLAKLDVDLAGDTASAIFSAFDDVVELLAGGIKILTRAHPNLGDVEARILVDQDVVQGSGAERQRIGWPIWILDGYWTAATATSETDLALGTTGTIGPFTPGGNRKTQPVFTITCQTAGSNPAIGNPANGQLLSIAGAFSSSDVIVVDCPNRTVTLNGTRAKNLLSINRGFWMELVPNIATSLDWTADSGSWDVVTSWKVRTR